MANHETKSSGTPWVKIIFIMSLCVIAGAVYVTSANNEQASTPESQTPPPPVAEYMTTHQQQVRTWTHYSGRLSAINRADIKPLVSGELIKVNFEDGQTVSQGDLLFVIDPRPYEAALKRIEAQLASAQSRAKLAKDELLRSEQLVKNKLVSESVYDAARNEYQVATAAIKEVESALVEAKIDLNYCYIKAPFSGRVSRAEITVGNIVEVNTGAPTLTTLVSHDKLYAEFDVDEQTYLRSIRQQRDPQQMPVQMTLAADETVVYKGHIDSFDNQLDVTSGTIRARAIFDNTDGVLIPGMYANVRLGSGTEQAVLLIPERAINTNQDRKFVYVIDENNVASYREVILGDYHQQQRIVLQGLKADERVIVNGLSHIRPNSPVTPKAIEQQ